MKILTFKKSILRIAGLALGVIMLASCGKDNDGPDDPRANYPKDVTIEYKITATTASLTKGDISYTNETGGQSRADDVALPFSKTVKRKVEYGAVVLNGFSANQGGGVKLEILVDGKVVTTETFTDTSYLNASITHGFN